MPAPSRRLEEMESPAGVSVKGVSPLLLSNCFPFRELEEPDLQRLSAAAECRFVPDGTILFQQGEVAKAVFVLLDGAVTLERRESGCGPSTHDIVGPYATVGDEVILGDPLRQHTARAASRLIVARLSLGNLMAVLDEYPDLLENWIRSVGARLLQKERCLGDGLLERIRRKVTDFVAA